MQPASQSPNKSKGEAAEMPERYVTLASGGQLDFFTYASLGERKQSSPHAALFTWSHLL